MGPAHPSSPGDTVSLGPLPSTLPPPSTPVGRARSTSCARKLPAHHSRHPWLEPDVGVTMSMCDSLQEGLQQPTLEGTPNCLLVAPPLLGAYVERALGGGDSIV